MAGFEGRIALVTGAGSGIGRAAALRLARDGAIVVATDVRVDAARETALLAGSGAVALELDVRDPASWERVLASLPAAQDLSLIHI